MRGIILHLKKLDWILIATTVLLVGFGLLSIHSSSSRAGNLTDFNKQVIFFAVGLILMFLVSFVDWRLLKESSYLLIGLYSFGIILLIGLFFFAPEIRGTKTWYRVGPVSIDPIELIQITMVILLAKYFSKRHVEMYRINHILLSGLYLLLPVILIFLQPNFGSVIILLSLWLGILIVSGIRIRHFLILILCGLLLFVFSWQTLLKNYQKERILSFVRPQASDTLKVGWSQRQAKIAIGSGGVFGQGIGKGSQTQYGFLPEPQTDFIFAAIAEETGLAGVSTLFLLFSILIWRIMRVAIHSANNFARLYASGVTILLISQVFINIGMNIGLSPIIGISMPFISYGGSSLITIFTSLGILQNIQTDR
ncbi:MAG: FtsW/RodA/SpoVE family cell cycle protein [Candidatus Wildermuthbacteria bacterium]|nr:FtsW/RodA/SpoVE family cell cycle protein [Candidatus Wildermuthbacteria bacterium]